jgi:hypothetical protein
MFATAVRACSLALAVALCACGRTPVPPATDPTIYADCLSLANCGFASNVCQYFAVAYSPAPDGLAEAQICTVTCASDASCPFGFNGQIGFCAPYGMIGNERPACVPRCFTDNDCAPDLICLDASQLTTGGFLPIGTLLCVPG